MEKLPGKHSVLLRCGPHKGGVSRTGAVIGRDDTNLPLSSELTTIPASLVGFYCLV